MIINRKLIGDLVAGDIILINGVYELITGVDYISPGFRNVNTDVRVHIRLQCDWTVATLEPQVRQNK